MAPTKFKIAVDGPEEQQTVEAPVKSTAPTSNNWTDHKENIQPLKQGRKIDDLMKSLSLIDNVKCKKELLLERKRIFDKELEENKEDLNKQFDIWYAYIDWLEQNYPDGGKTSNITAAIEQCIEIYYNKKQFKQDKRLFNVFMKFQRFCDEPIEIYGFMYSNSICVLLACFYLNWSMQYELRKNMKKAEDIIKLGIDNLATPREDLIEAREQIKFRIQKMISSGEINECQQLAVVTSRESQKQLAKNGIRAALQTLKFKATNRNNRSGQQNMAADYDSSCAKVSNNRVGINAVDVKNIGGLKSQIKMVNGVVCQPEIRPKPQAGATKLKKMSSGDKRTDGAVFKEPLLVMEKLPTLQRIQSVGRTGKENCVQTSGRI